MNLIPVTDDTTQVWLLVGLVVFSLAAIAALIILRIRKGKK